jgi:hypothetical protein
MFPTMQGDYNHGRLEYNCQNFVRLPVAFIASPVPDNSIQRRFA